MLLIDALVMVAQEELRKLGVQGEESSSNLIVRNGEAEEMAKESQAHTRPLVLPVALRFCKRKRSERKKVAWIRTAAGIGSVAHENALLPGEEKGLRRSKPRKNLEFAVEGNGVSNVEREVITGRRNNKSNNGQEIQRREGVDNRVFDPPPELSENFRNLITNFINEKLQPGGGDAWFLSEDQLTLIIQKKLSQTDLTSHHNRFSIPFRQVKKEFLNEEERRFLEQRDQAGRCNSIPLDIIEPSGRTNKIFLRRWEMKKPGGKASSLSYVLTGSWNEIKKGNQLLVGAWVQLWAVRAVQGLYLILVDLNRQE